MATPEDNKPLSSRRLGISSLSPGDWVRHPTQPDWGKGQVQSVDGNRVTVNFEHRGKLLINAAIVALEPIDPNDFS